MSKDIAVIGVGVNYPYSKTTRLFWENLAQERDFISSFPINRLNDVLPFYEDAFRHTAYGDSIDFEMAKGAFLEEIDKFDNQFFKISPLEAKVMDPCQRIFLQTAISAIEDGGYGGNALKNSRTGVFVGFMPDYRPFNYKDLALRLTDISLDLLLPATLVSVIPSRVSYFLDLKGPTLCLDTSCSASLVAIHQACLSLLTGESEMAIAGGIKLNLAPLASITRPIIESPTGYSRTFDASADGIGIGEGAGAVLLKPLKQAIDDLDNIYAVIRGSAINQDGRSNGIAAPNLLAQADVIDRAWIDSEINPEDISYIEAHGTGTRVGDPIEVNALDKVFKKYTSKRQFCAISSVKTNLGHLYEGAGITAFIKAVLCLKNKKIPQTLHFNTPNENINFIDSALYVTSRLEEWHTVNNKSRICGVNAFGISGTNCHIVLEEFTSDLNAKCSDVSNEEIITFSAYNENSLKQMITLYKEYIADEATAELRDICYTTNIGKGQYPWRLAIICKNYDDLRDKINYILKNWGCAENENIFYSKKPIYQVFELENPNAQHLREISPRFLAKEYIEGAIIRWEKFYEGQVRRKVSVPLYPFEKKRFWFEFQNEYIEKIILRNPHHYALAWRENEYSSNETLQTVKVILLIASSKNQSTPLEEVLVSQRHIVRTLIIETLQKVEEEFAKINWIEIDHIVHLSTLFRDPVQTLNDLRNSQDLGMFQLHYLLSALKKVNFKKQIKITLITDGSQSILSSETVCKPENNSLIGLGKIIEREFTQITCKAIDIDRHMPGEALVKELFDESKPYLKVFRNHVKYTQEFTPVDFSHRKKKEISIRHAGTYVITGGTGGIGLTFALYLANKAKVNIVLISRSGVVKDDKKQKILEKIKSLGCNIDIYSGDSSNYDFMASTFNTLKEKYGSINGVLHCAGIAGSSFSGQQSIRIFKEVSTSKIEGTFIIDLLTKNENLDFLVLFSSVATVFPAVGQGDYCAANSYLDAFASFAHKKGKRVHAINWVAWKDIGMAKDLHTNVNTTFKAISNEAALAGFDKALEYQLPLVLIGELNAKDKIILSLKKYGIKLSDYLIKKMNAFESENVTIETKNTEVQAVVLSGRNDNSYTTEEVNVGAIWGAVLGYSEFNIYDNIYDIGGDSLMAMEIAGQCGKKFNYTINIHDVLKCENIARLAKYIKMQNLKIA